MSLWHFPCSHPLASYLSHLSQFLLHVVNLVGFKPQGSKHKHEHHHHNQGQTGANSHESSTLLMAPHPLLGRREGPAWYQTRRLTRVLCTPTSIHEVHLWQRIALVTAHGARPTVRQNVCSYVASA